MVRSTAALAAVAIVYDDQKQIQTQLMVVKAIPEAVVQEAVLNKCKTAGGSPYTIWFKWVCFNRARLSCGSQLAFFRLDGALLLFIDRRTGAADWDNPNLEMTQTALLSFDKKR